MRTKNQSSITHKILYGIMLLTIIFVTSGARNLPTILVQKVKTEYLWLPAVTSDEICILSGTVQLSSDVKEAVKLAIQSAKTEVDFKGAECFAPVDVRDENEWTVINLVGIVDASNDSGWKVASNAVWSDILIIHFTPNVITAAVAGTSLFSTEIAKIPSSILSPNAKRIIDPLTHKSVIPSATNSYIFPYEAGYQVYYGTKDGGVHPGEFTAVIGTGSLAVDLLSDGNTSSNHAPNRLLAVTSGTVTKKCSDTSKNSTYILVDNGTSKFLYAHIKTTTAPAQWASVNQGDPIGELVVGGFDDNVCGYADQTSPYFHVHLEFPNMSTLTLSDWTLNTSNEIWTRGGETWLAGQWKQVGSSGCSSNPSPNNNQIGLYADFNYCGAYKILDVGEYNNPAAMGFDNDSASSIKIGSNVTANLYKDDNYQGSQESFSVSDANLSDNAIGDNAVSSVKVIVKSSGGPEGYKYCSKEGESCNFSGSAELAYGANGNFRYLTRSDGITCNNDSFGGDPLPGVQKSCYIRGGGPPTYTQCAAENGICNVVGTADVAYGASLIYNYQYGIVGSVNCNNDVFGDPIQGTPKNCYYKTTIPPTDEAQFVGQSAYPTVNPGETFQIYFELRNAGSTIWQPGTYWLQNLQNPLGANAQQALSQSVAPNGSYRWAITQTAPTTAGTYRTQWMISHNGTTFGPNMFVDVTVNNSIDVNLLVNPGSETGTSAPEAWVSDAWTPSYSTFTWDSLQTHSGSKSLKITSSTANDARWIQTINVQQNATYRISGWVKTENVAHSTEINDIGANLSTLVDLPTNSSGLLGTNDWTYLSYTFNTGTKTQITFAARLGMYSGVTTGTAWFDDLRLELLSTPICYTLNKTSNPGAGGTVTSEPTPNCNEGTQYLHGTTVKLTASPNTGYIFSNWSGGASGSSNPINVPMTENKSITAIFSQSSYHTISGNAGVGDALITYTGGSTNADINGNYFFTVSQGWSGMVTPSKSGYSFTPPGRSYTNIITDQAGQNYTAILCSTATVNVNIGGTLSGCYNLSSGQSTRQSYNTNNGPVKIANIASINIIAAERINYFVGSTVTSYSEMMGLPDGQLDTTYWFPWYKNDSQVSTQIRIGNVSGSDAHVHISIAGAEVAGSPYTLTTTGNGQSMRLEYAANGGPVKIWSDQNIVATERVNFFVGSTVASYTEIMGLPNSQLDTTYWFPWYKNVGDGIDTQLRIGNVSGSEAHVHIYIAGAEVAGSPYTLTTTGDTQSMRLSYTANNGPVKIVSDQNIVASERVNYFVDGVVTSYAEMMGQPNSQLDTTYWFPWYKNDSQVDTQIRIGNVSGSEAHVHVYIGTAEMAGSPFTLTTTGSTQSMRLSFTANDGPVKIVSDQNIVATERVNFFVGSKVASYSEMMGLPNIQLDTTYWFPWYKNVGDGIDTQLRFGIP